MEKGYSPLDYRYLFLGAHYRMPLTFSLESLDQSKAGRQNLMEKLAGLESVKPLQPDKAKALPLWRKFWEQLEDDLNAPRALAVLWELAKDKDMPRESKAGLVSLMDQCLGLDLLKPEQKKEDAPLNAAEQALLDARKKARADKLWARSDELRKQLLELGVVVEDTKEGMKWKRK